MLLQVFRSMAWVFSSGFAGSIYLWIISGLHMLQHSDRACFLLGACGLVTLDVLNAVVRDVLNAVVREALMPSCIQGTDTCVLSLLL